MNPLSESEALQRAAARCSTTEMCRNDVLQLLLRWGLEPATAERVLEYLEREKYLDEARFANAFVKDKLRYNGWGRLKISQALRQKGVSHDAANKALEELDEREYSEILLKTLQQKNRSVKAGSGYERFGKLMRFGLGRGFLMDEIRQAMVDMKLSDDDTDF